MMIGTLAFFALTSAETISREPLGVMHERLDAGLDHVLDDLHLLLDVDLALGRLHLQVDAEAIGRLLRAAAHVDEERMVQRLQDQRHGRLVGVAPWPVRGCRTRTPRRSGERA